MPGQMRTSRQYGTINGGNGGEDATATTTSLPISPPLPAPLSPQCLKHDCEVPVCPVKQQGCSTITSTSSRISRSPRPRRRTLSRAPPPSIRTAPRRGRTGWGRGSLWRRGMASGSTTSRPAARQKQAVSRRSNMLLLPLLLPFSPPPLPYFAPLAIMFALASPPPSPLPGLPCTSR